MRVIAYAYMADVHCPACTAAAIKSGGLRVDHSHPLALGPRFSSSGGDENGIPLDVVDREWNMIGPVFSTDENDFTHCCDCGGEL